MYALPTCLNETVFSTVTKLTRFRKIIHVVIHAFAELVILTGASSGLGRKTAQALLRSGDYHVIGAVRDLEKMESVAEIDEFNMENFTPMYCELNSFESVRTFCNKINEFRMSKPIDRLVCNAGVYQPSLPYPKWSVDNHEQTMQINFLSHFLMISLLIPAMMESRNKPRVIMVGSVTGNDNTVGGGYVTLLVYLLLLPTVCICAHRLHRFLFNPLPICIEACIPLPTCTNWMDSNMVLQIQLPWPTDMDLLVPRPIKIRNYV